MNAITLLALAIAPGIAIAVLIYVKDKFDREPKKLLIISFALGMISILPAIVAEALSGVQNFDTSSLELTAFYSFGIIGIAEEGSKFIMLRFYAYPKKAFNEPFDGITYSVMVSMGFATVENILYAFQFGIGNTIVRMFTAVPAHATFAIVMGYYAGLAKFSGAEAKYLFRGVIYAALLHGAYDFFLLQQYIPGMTFGALVSLYFGLRFSRKAIRSGLKESPFRNMSGE